MTGEQPTEELRKELVNWVRKEIGPIASPDLIQFAPSLPKTRSGKIMRRILRKIAEDEFGNLGDTSTLADPWWSTIWATTGRTGAKRARSAAHSARDRVRHLTVRATKDSASFGAAILCQQVSEFISADIEIFLDQGIIFQYLLKYEKGSRRGGFGGPGSRQQFGCFPPAGAGGTGRNASRTRG